MADPTDLPPDLGDWLDHQPDADDLRRTWDLAALAQPDGPPAADTDAAWSRLDGVLDAPPPRAASASRAADRPAARRTNRVRARWATGVLAALAAVAVAVGLGDVTVRADAAVAQVVLPDGSEVALAPGSEVAYRRGLWGGTRRVRLDGQALFHVETDGRPFTVETFNATVEVLGTTFDVRAWADAPAPETAVALVEGSVRLSDGRGQSVVLAPGQASRVVDGAPSEPRAADVQAVVSWRGGGFAISDAPLGAVAQALQARFGLPVRLGARVDPGRRLTLYLPQADSAETVLMDVAAYLDLRLQVSPEGYDLVTR